MVNEKVKFVQRMLHSIERDPHRPRLFDSNDMETKKVLTWICKRLFTPFPATTGLLSDPIKRERAIPKRYIEAIPQSYYQFRL